MRFELGAEGYIAVVQGMIKEDTLQAGGRACAKGRTSCLENIKSYGAVCKVMHSQEWWKPSLQDGDQHDRR